MPVIVSVDFSLSMTTCPNMLFCRSQATREKRKKSVDEDEDEDTPVAKKPIKVRRCDRISS
jgi:hypothetical protein